MKHALPFLLLFLTARLCEGSTLRGKITDTEGNPLPYAALYIQNTSIGTISNVEGDYSIELEPGEYLMVFQYVGFKKTVKQISIATDTLTLDVVLEREVLQLKEVVISADEADPAYRVIRETIKRRKYHQRQVQAYQCKAYIKSMLSIVEKPDKIFGIPVPFGTGVLYLSESVSELNFEQPDKMKELMISSKVSGSSRGFSFNWGFAMLVSFYDNLIEGFSERGHVSPIAGNAMLFYDYKLAGLIQENDKLINKIQVIAKRRSDPVFEGFIYIIEDEWKIHSVDLRLTREHQLEMIDTLALSQVYAPVTEEIWMLVSQKIEFDISMFGFVAEGSSVGVLSEYQIEANPEQEETTAAKAQSNPAATEKLFDKKFFDNEVMIVKPESNKRDSSYWAKTRPMPLTQLEATDYRKHDSIEAVVTSKPYLDSTDREMNKISLGSVVFNGYTYRKSLEEKDFTFQPIFENLQFNTVEGAVVRLRSEYSKSENQVLKYQITPELRYGFSSRRAYGQLYASLVYNQHKFSRAMLRFGSFVYQFNDREPISPFINSLETLLNRRNYMKLYEKNFVKIGHQSELTNGLLLTTHLEYARRNELFNTSDYSFSYSDKRVFTRNAPANHELSNSSFGSSDALKLDLIFSIQFKQQYITRPYRKVIMGSKYPELRIHYSKALAVLGADANYDRLDITVRDQIDYQLFGSGDYSLSAGTFFNDKKLTLIDFKHFNGNQSILAQFKPGNFQLLDYYFFSTTNAWFSGQYSHHFNGFILNKLPLLRKTKVQAVGTVRFLYTETSSDYVEYGFGLEHIFKILRVDYYGALWKGKYYGSGVRLGMGF